MARMSATRATVTGVVALIPAGLGAFFITVAQSQTTPPESIWGNVWTRVAVGCWGAAVVVVAAGLLSGRRDDGEAKIASPPTIEDEAADLARELLAFYEPWATGLPPLEYVMVGKAPAGALAEADTVTLRWMGGTTTCGSRVRSSRSPEPWAKWLVWRSRWRRARTSRTSPPAPKDQHHRRSGAGCTAGGGRCSAVRKISSVHLGADSRLQVMDYSRHLVCQTHCSFGAEATGCHARSRLRASMKDRRLPHPAV